MRTSALPLLALLAASCGDDPWENYSYVWHGNHVTLYGYGFDESDVCGGSLAELDGHSKMIADALGLQVPPYVFRWISEDYWNVLNPCPEGIVACAMKGVAMAPVLPQMHEATHAMLATAGVECPRLLDEGLAMYFDVPTPTWRLYLTSKYKIEDLLEAGNVPLDGRAYVRAGHFVAYLVESYGTRPIMELCAVLPREPTLAQWSAAASSILDKPLDELLADYKNYPRCNYQLFRARLWGCAKRDVTFSGELHVDAGCADAQATNPAWSGWWGDYGDAQLLRRVYFPTDTWVRMSAHAVGPSGLDATYTAQECVPCSEIPQVRVEIDGVDLEFFRAGLHEIVVYFDRRDSVVLDMVEVK